jgi:IS30 family transposase
MVSTVRKFDIDEYSKKGVDALSKMMTTQEPGHKTVGSKHDVVMAIRKQIQDAYNAGYTVQQIAEAFKNGDVFGILPKTITEVIRGDKKPSSVKKQQRTTPAKKHSAPAKKTTTEPATGAQKIERGGFEIKHDTPDGEL